MSSKLVLVLNCGSSSLKFAIIDAVNGEEYLSGLAECFHLPEARIKWKMDGNKQEAAVWVIILIAISFPMVFLLGRLAGDKRKERVSDRLKEEGL